jgi:catechol 2,3-dioxygenase-like lactoylglutathione lyase family enzyme
MAKIKHIAIFTESPAKLAQFYTEVFGMTVTDTIGDRAVWITDGYVDVALLHRRHEKMPKGTHHWGFTLEPAEKDAIYAKLRARGLEPYCPGTDRPYVEDAVLDIDGNRFDLSTGMREIDEEMKAARPAPVPAE